MQKFMFFLLLISTLQGFGQNTVGIIFDSADSYEGYTLFTTSTETYLVNNCGQVINQWTSSYTSGHAVYILENGDLIRAGKVDNTDIVFGGLGGIIERFDWDGNKIWEYIYSDSQKSQHHDIYPISNGNILLLAVTIMTNAEAIQAGRDPSTLSQSVLYNEQIVEIKPQENNTATIVWEWNLKDHLIQDFDNTKDNFGVVSENPQLLNINYVGNSENRSNWIHANSIQYNATLNQIVLSSRLLNEFYIIDHSTSTSEASTSIGGTYGKGGDFLYRWGNPLAYGQGTSTDQQLYGQHFPHYISEGLQDEGKIILFNNGFRRTPSFSEINIINPPTTSPGNYIYNTGTAYGPTSPEFEYTDPVDNTNFYSTILSSAQRLPNNNILICEGASGHFFEINSNNNIVWEYNNPASFSGPLTQGDNPDFASNTTFRITKYAPSYDGFIGKNLTPGDPIELNPDLTPCNTLSVTNVELKELKLFPNPAKDKVKITKGDIQITRIEIYDLLGKLVQTSSNQTEIDIAHFSRGIYFVKIYTENVFTFRKILKI